MMKLHSQLAMWKDIPGYEGLYKISDLGQVQTLRKSTKLNPGSYLTQRPNEHGYSLVTLYKGGKRKTFSVHRLVALAFMRSPHSNEEINHINENKQDNRLTNLEWVTHKGNLNYGLFKRRVGLATSKRVAQCDLLGNIVATFSSTMDAERATGVSNQSISGCANGRKHYLSAGGFKWKYVN